IALQLLTYFAIFGAVFAFPQDRHTVQSQDADKEEPVSLISSEALENLYSYGRTLSRLRRALEELAYEEAADDMELAEINVFRPLFRYRSQVIRARNPQQQQFG
ncbi:hypothetical protein KR018_010297, partial [Drosophila ironensis]